MNIINSWLKGSLNKMEYSKETERPIHYWTCNTKGELPIMLENLIKEKKEHKKKGNKVMETAVKLYINSLWVNRRFFFPTLNRTM